ncbi:Delta-1-pyrroline-5-carboxylate synthase [Halotydeus destructor]|nr:Delta-1-pyrroline-5-carboxylate synthase [Halotydeus destructor]
MSLLLLSSLTASRRVLVRHNATGQRFDQMATVVKGPAMIARSLHHKKGLRAIQASIDQVRGHTLGTSLKRAFETRNDLKKARRVVVKLGSAVITREDQNGLALGRLASIVEQISQLQNEGREMLLVSSGSVAFGKQRLLNEIRMSMSMRETLYARKDTRAMGQSFLEPRAAAAVGQSGLMALYDAMFTQYGVNIAQVLVTKPDFYNPVSRVNLRTTFSELLALNIVPIVNTNDAVVSPSTPDFELNPANPDANVVETPGIIIHDNDSLAAHLAVEVGADLLILMSDVDGVFNLPPGTEGSRLFTTFSPTKHGLVKFGSQSKVGTGGMESKVYSAAWALERGVSVVICNGEEEQGVNKVVQGKPVGTFFTDAKQEHVAAEVLASDARKGSRKLQSLTADQRADVLRRLADLLQNRKQDILRANSLDMAASDSAGLSKPLLSRLFLTPEKLNSLSSGLNQLAESTLSCLGRPLKRTLLADGLKLTQVTVPIGVLLVIFESRPDVLPQIAGLSIATGNGLLLKGGKEAINTNNYLNLLVKEALSTYDASEAIGLINTREDVSNLLALDNYIDLVVPRGSNELVRTIKEQSRSIPVLGHAEGVCHVYVDEDADFEKATRIVRDSKCDYPAACNAMETLLIHIKHIESGLFSQICAKLKSEDVTIHAGPKLKKLLQFGPPLAKSMRTEYSGLECTIEVVDDVDEAINHINAYGSSHTDTIVTNDAENALKFKHSVDSACVFHNCSTRFADGYRFGLGAEVGISTSRIHARGPVGIEGLLSTKWIVDGDGHTVRDFADGHRAYKHLSLPTTTD